MLRSLILIVIALCVLSGPAVAADYCPTVTVPENARCYCIVRNYYTIDDTLVYITIYMPPGFTAHTTGPHTAVKNGGYVYTYSEASEAGLCGCKVTGESSYTRTSLVVTPGDLDTHTPYVAVPCN